MRRPYPGGASQDGFSGIYSWSGEEQCEGEISLFLCDFHWVRAWRGVGRCCEHWQLLSKDGRLGDGEKSVGRRARIVEELATWAWTGPLAPACASLRRGVRRQRRGWPVAHCHELGKREGS